MDEKVIELLRDLASVLEGPDLERSPLTEISDLGQQAIPSLIAALGHVDPVIRKVAAFALGEMRSPFGETLDPTPAVPHLEHVLAADTDPNVRRQAAESLWYLCESKKAVHAFIRGLSDEDVDIRRWAAVMLGLPEAQIKEAISPLIHALDDDDLLVRRISAEVLGMFGPDAAEALPKLESLLGEDEWTRTVGAEAILSIRPDRTDELGPILIEATRSRSSRIRYLAVEALAKLPAVGKLAIPELIAALEDKNEAVRMAALGAIPIFGVEGSPAVPTLLSILRGEGRDGGDLQVRGRAADALAEIGEGTTETAYFLIESLGEPGDHPLTIGFRLRVARALWRIQEDSSYLLEIGLRTIRNPSWWLRRIATIFLGDLGVAGRAAVPHLRRLMRDDHPAVREVAEKALQKIEAG